MASGLRQDLRSRARSAAVAWSHSMNAASSMIRSAIALLVVALAVSCGHVRPSQREHLASPAMQFEMDPVAVGQRDSILEITEGGTYSGAGPGTAGAGCGCN